MLCYQCMQDIGPAMNLNFVLSDFGIVLSPKGILETLIGRTLGSSREHAY